MFVIYVGGSYCYEFLISSYLYAND